MLLKGKYIPTDQRKRGCNSFALETITVWHNSSDSIRHQQLAWITRAYIPVHQVTPGHIGICPEILGWYEIFFWVPKVVVKSPGTYFLYEILEIANPLFDVTRCNHIHNPPDLLRSFELCDYLHTWRFWTCSALSSDHHLSLRVSLWRWLRKY